MQRLTRVRKWASIGSRPSTLYLNRPKKTQRNMRSSGRWSRMLTVYWSQVDSAIVASKAKCVRRDIVVNPVSPILAFVSDCKSQSSTLLAMYSVKLERTVLNSTRPHRTQRSSSCQKAVEPTWAEPCVWVAVKPIYKPKIVMHSDFMVARWKSMSGTGTDTKSIPIWSLN